MDGEAADEEDEYNKVETRGYNITKINDRKTNRVGGKKCKCIQ